MSSSIAGTSGPDGESVTGSPEEVVDPAPRPVRRSFTAAYRARVVAEYEAAPRGKKGGVLRREGLYQSQIREWTAARDAVAHGVPPTRRPHRPSGSPGPESEGDRLRAENQRLTRELAKSQAVVEIMGKLQGLLDATSESTATPRASTRR